MPSKGSTSQRGYGAAHQALRDRYKPLVRSGKALCGRCGGPIQADGPWDLGHDDHNRDQYTGPEHIKCNRATKGRHTRHTPPTDTSRQW